MNIVICHPDITMYILFFLKVSYWEFTTDMQICNAGLLYPYQTVLNILYNLWDVIMLVKETFDTNDATSFFRKHISSFTNDTCIFVYEYDTFIANLATHIMNWSVITETLFESRVCSPVIIHTVIFGLRTTWVSKRNLFFHIFYWKCIFDSFNTVNFWNQTPIISKGRCRGSHSALQCKTERWTKNLRFRSYIAGSMVNLSFNLRRLETQFRVFLPLPVHVTIIINRTSFDSMIHIIIPSLHIFSLLFASL